MRNLKSSAIIAYLLMVSITKSSAQIQKTEVLTLGTFHFAFHNRDIKKFEKEEQIDVLDKKYQDEIIKIVEQLAKFKPNIIAIEVDPALQSKTDSLYNCYRKGTYQLNKEEHQQIGFRLAKKLNLDKLYCVNDWGHNYNEIDSLLSNDSIGRKKFIDFLSSNPDSSLVHYSKDLFKTKGIIAHLKEINKPANLKKDLGNYLIGAFKYEIPSNSSFGTDFTTGWWFNRNLRIFRNIQKINTSSNDKIVVIYGAGHMNILNILFDCSPEYNRVSTNKYLK